MGGSGRARARTVASVALVLAVGATLIGCRTEYRGAESGLDGVLWRQVASVEDPLMLALSNSLTPDADSFLEQLPATLWGGPAAPVPDLDEPVAVVYDLERGDGGELTFSAFISSGRRVDVPTDAGGRYDGPDSVFTCSRWTVRFGAYAVESAERGALGQHWEDCPAELVEAMPGDVAFAEPDVFGG